MTAQSSAGVAQRAEPWDWRPAADGWCDALAAAAVAWTPRAGIGLDVETMRGRIAEAARAREGWLLHPALAALTCPGATVHNDLQLAAWATANSRVDLGGVELPAEAWLWAPAGGFAVTAGEYSLTELAGWQADASDAPPIALDVWSDSVGFPSPAGYPPPEQTWCGTPPAGPDEAERLRGEIVTYLRAITLLVTAFPACAAWTRAVTRVVIALRGAGAGSFGSGSHPDLPGVVYIDMAAGERYVLEGLIHESAHRHLNLAEAGAPLVDPAHTELHESPLRPEPRPLRGILLAVHALAYMRAFYAEWTAANLPGIPDGELADLTDKCDAAGEVLDRNRHGLTMEGGDFLNRTMEVAAHAG